MGSTLKNMQITEEFYKNLNDVENRWKEKISSSSVISMLK